MGRVLVLTLFGSMALWGETDWHSFADLRQARVTHSEFRLRVDFERRVLNGWVRHRLSRAVRELSLDSRDLEIAAVWCGRRAGRYTLGPEDKIRGRELRLEFEKACRDVRIEYATKPEASGLRWIESKGTAGGRRPFLATQSWSIHARSWAPLQDTPRVKFTYTARVEAPEGMLAVMSAENPQRVAAGGRYRFRQRRPIPPHLLALAVGEMEFVRIGGRTGVYADPAKAAAARAEFSDAERMLEAAERIAGPYRWGRFDILVLPPGARFGGMENPRVTFVSDMLLAGDKSRVSVIAHELAHAWSGNQVSNATWGDIWVSEGITTYLTYRIQAAVYGDRGAAAEYLLSVRNLERAMAAMQPALRVVHQDGTGRHPDEMLGPVPYSKGSLVMHEAEARAGRAAVDRWLRQFFGRHAWESLTTADVKRELHLVPAELREAWLESAEMPEAPGTPYRNWMPLWSEKTAGLRRGDRAAFTGWTQEEVQVVLGNLREDPGRVDCAALEAGLAGFSQPEVRRGWLEIAVRADYRGAERELREYLAQTGRREARELFALLSGKPFWRGVAREWLGANAERLGGAATTELESVLQ